jgi:linoleoyl-CoA desaturase
MCHFPQWRAAVPSIGKCRSIRCPPLEVSFAVQPLSSTRSFADEVKAEVSDYFSRNRLSKRGNAAMIAKSVILLTAYLGSYGLILSGLPTVFGMWFLCLVMGVAMAGLGFSVCHDALHGAYAADPRVNRLLGYVFDALGANSYMWRLTHNRLHHLYTNVRGYDEDVDVSPLIRLSPHSPHQPIHRFQHVYAFLLYALSTVFWVFAKDYGYFLRRHLGPYKDMKHPASAWVFLIVSKLAYYLAMIALPLLVLDIAWWQFLIGFLTVHATAGLILGGIFQLAHVVETTQHISENDAATVKLRWMEHQLRTTNDFARGNRVLSWYLGGINFQIEHHLFPKICHVHYPAISPIIEAVAARHGIPHNSCPTLLSAVRSHYRTLKRLGKPD